MSTEVSVVIPTFNRFGSLARCVDTLPSDVEVIVVDDGSTDGTSQRIRSLSHPRLVYSRQPRNSGPAAARNAGVARASGEIVAFTDDDCVPAKGWPYPLVEELEDSPSDVAGVGGRVLPYHESAVARFSTFHGILEPPQSLGYLVTANCAYRRDVLERVAGFDERIPFAGGEDPGLSARVRALGHRFAFTPDAVVYHDYRPGWVDFARTFYRYGFGCALSALSGPKVPSPTSAHLRSSSTRFGYRGYSLGFATDDLVPPPLTMGSLVREMAATWREYNEGSVPYSDRLPFLALKLTQRVAYNSGWSQGERVSSGRTTRGASGSRNRGGRTSTSSGGYAGVAVVKVRETERPRKRRRKTSEEENPDDYHPSGDDIIVSDEDLETGEDGEDL